MADLIRQATVEQGYDPTDFVLYAYGGAGPLHAFSYGAELGIRKVMVPATASVHSAFGIAVSDLTVAEELSAPILSPPGTTDYSAVIRPEMVQASFDRLTARALDRLREEGADLNAVTTSRSVEMRFRFQIHALTIPVPEEKLDAAAIDALVRRFIDTYEARLRQRLGIHRRGHRIDDLPGGRKLRRDASRTAQHRRARPRRDRPPQASGRSTSTAIGGLRASSSRTTCTSAPASTASPSSRCRTPP